MRNDRSGARMNGGGDQFDILNVFAPTANKNLKLLIRQSRLCGFE